MLMSTNKKTERDARSGAHGLTPTHPRAHTYTVQSPQGTDRGPSKSRALLCTYFLSSINKLFTSFFFF